MHSKAPDATRTTAAVMLRVSMRRGNGEWVRREVEQFIASHGKAEIILRRDQTSQRMEATVTPDESYKPAAYIDFHDS
jgi:hypothetical protein